MPSAPLKFCSSAGCSAKVTSGRCQAHQKAKRAVETRYQAGNYGRPWRRLRDAHLAEHPWCAACAKAGLERLADEVDHVIPHRGDQALLKDMTNLQSLCKSHHSEKTARESGWSA